MRIGHTVRAAGIATLLIERLGEERPHNLCHCCAIPTPVSPLRYTNPCVTASLYQTLCLAALHQFLSYRRSIPLCDRSRADVALGAGDRVHATAVGAGSGAASSGDGGGLARALVAKGGVASLRGR